MKKVVFILVLAASLFGGVTAQDTLWMKPAPLGNYFYDDWFDTVPGRYVAGTEWWGINFAVARQFVTQDTLQVYGIAAMMVHSLYWLQSYIDNPAYPWYTDSSYWAIIHNRYPEDPTLDNLEESLLLFQYSGNGSPQMTQLGDSLPVHYMQTPVSHYIMSNREPVMSNDTRAKPVYERYFRKPQTVHDTFYVGYTQSHNAYSYEDSSWYDRRMPFINLGFDPNMEGALWLSYDERMAFFYKGIPYNPDTSWWRFSWGDYAHYIFPILTPEPLIDTNAADTTGVDTTGVDTTGVDTTGISGVRMLERYTAVMPNPASGKVRVTSSFGLSGIEVFDGQGRCVHEAPASGYQTAFDVSSWPRGTYLVRIHTPMGTTTRKLTVM